MSDSGYCVGTISWADRCELVATLCHYVIPGPVPLLQVPPHPHQGPHSNGDSRTSGDLPTPTEPASASASSDGNTAATPRVPEEKQHSTSTSRVDNAGCSDAGGRAAAEEAAEALHGRFLMDTAARGRSLTGTAADGAEAPGAAGLLGFLDHPSRNVSLDGGIAAHTLASWGASLEEERRRGHGMSRPGSLSVFVPAPAGDAGVASGMGGEGELPEGTADEAGPVGEAQEEGRDGDADDVEEEVEADERLSCIAHTPRAFDLVDAGGMPSGSEAAAAAAVLPGQGVRRLPRRRISDVQLGRSMTLQPTGRAPGSGGGADFSGHSGRPAGGAEGQEWSAPPQLHRAATQLPSSALPRRPGQQAPPEWHPAFKASGGDLSPVGSPRASAGSRNSRSFVPGAGVATADRHVAPATDALRPSPRSLELRLPAHLPPSESGRMRADAAVGGAGGGAPYDVMLSLPPGEPLDAQDAPAEPCGDGSGAAPHGVLQATVSAVRLLRPGADASDPMEPAARASPKRSFAGFTNNSEVPRGGAEVLPGRPSSGQGGGGGDGLVGNAPARGNGGVAGVGAGAVGACVGRAACPTCGKCTCQACRARALATAAVVEQGGAVVVGQRLPATALQIAMAARESNRVVLTEGPAGARGPSGTGGVMAAPAAAVQGAAVPWARGGAMGGMPNRGPSTQGRKRASITLDLAAPSVALAPY